jgi:hypothetical protein
MSEKNKKCLSSQEERDFLMGKREKNNNNE